MNFLNSTQRSDFRIKNKYHLNRERGGECRPFRGEKMIFRKDNWIIRCMSGVVLHSSPLSWDKKVNLP